MSEESPKFLVVYHGCCDKNRFYDLRVWGPDDKKEFNVTPDREIALEMAEGNLDRVLIYQIPIKLVGCILGMRKPYLGMVGEGAKFVIIGEASRRLHTHLSLDQKIFPY